MSLLNFPPDYKEVLSKLRDSHLEQGLILRELERKQVFLVGELNEFFQKESKVLILLLDQKMFEDNNRIKVLIAHLEGEAL